MRKPTIYESIAWAIHLLHKAMRGPRVIQPSRNEPHQGKQECARRRTQMAKYGDRYWLPTWPPQEG